MAIGFRSATEAGTGAASTTQVISVPSGVQDGDLLLASIGTADGDTGSVSLNGTWQGPLVNNLNTGGSAPSPPGCSVYWRIASSEPASYTITDTESSGICGQMMAFTGVDQTTPIDVTTTTATGDSTNANPPSINHTGNGDEVTVVGAFWDSTTAVYSAPPTNYTSSGGLGAIIGTGGGNGLSMATAYRLTGLSDPEDPGTFTSSTEQWGAWTVVLRAAVSEGITDVTPDDFDFDNADVDIDGANFEAVQGTGAVYLSDASTLAGSVNEVEIDGAINTWADTLINLDFTGMTQTEIDNLHTLGPGARYVIVTNDTGDEYSFAITLHRPKAFGLSLSTQFAEGDNTTAQLTAPATKTTGDFGGGKMQESANPGTTVDVGADEYREDEWCMEALPNSVESETYQFRVLIGGVVADTVTVTPEMTISSIATPNITDAGDELFELNETNIVITGTDFGATETGSAKVELVNNVVYASGTKVTQSVDTWSATSIQFDLVIGALTEIDLWLYVTDSVGTVSSGYPVQVYRTPTITNIEDEIFNASELSIVLDGTYLQSPQGTGKLEISDNAVYATGTKVSQTINSWNSTQINFDLEIGSIGQESMWMWVTNDLGRRSSSTAVTITGLPISDGLWKAQSFQGSITALGFNTTIFLIRDE